MQRLQSRAQFQAVLGGATVARTPHFALHRTSLEAVAADAALHGPLFAGTSVWVGAMVPKRWARRAVTRNAIKRQIYSVSTAPRMRSAAAHVVRLRAAFDRKQYRVRVRPNSRRCVRAELLMLFVKGDALMQRLLIALVQGLPLAAEPWLGSACRFEPSCSRLRARGARTHGAAAGSYLDAAPRWRVAIPGATVASTRCRQPRDWLPPCPLSFLPRQEVIFMNDIRRTILWVIFGFSLVLLWDQWQVHNGRKPPSSLGRATGHRRGRHGAAPRLPPPTARPTASGVGAVPARYRLPLPRPRSGRPRCRAARRTRRGAGAHRGQHRRAQADLRHQGGSLVHSEFLQLRGPAEKNKPFVLLDQSADRVYVAQTGLIGGALSRHTRPR